MFRSPLQRLAHRLYVASGTEPPLAEIEWVLAIYLNAGCGLVVASVAAYAGAGAAASVALFPVVTVLLSGALWHRFLFWVPLLTGTALTVGAGALVGWLVGTLESKAVGVVVGVTLAGLTYGRLIFRKLRRRAK